MKVIRLFCVVIVLSLTLFAVTPAQAKAPVPGEPLPDVDVKGEPLDWCDFEILVDYTLHWERLDFIDSKGNIVRSLIHLYFTDHYYNPKPGGKEAFGRGKLITTLTPDYGKDRGLSYHVVAPGGGTLLIDAGYVYWPPEPAPLIFHGNHQAWEGDFSRLCAYLK